uniref:Uncharacterized protein n=1 Tax=Globodera rostochiensis TaxID=31243 RepID=A0A914H8A9_GLORO
MKTEFPCCPGSQKVVSLMNSHIGTFSASMSQTELCSSAEKLEGNLRIELGQTSAGCLNGGDKALMRSIDVKLPTSADECAHTADHAGNNNNNNSAWSTLVEQFNHQIDVIDKNCDELKMSIGKVNFSLGRESDAHQEVPGPDTVLANPGKFGSHNKL